MGYDQQAGGGWSGDLLVADWDQIENAEYPSEIYIRRLKSAEIEVVKNGDNFRFPLAHGELRQPGSDRHKNRPKRPRRARGDPAPEDKEDEEEVKSSSSEEAPPAPAVDDHEQPEIADSWSFNGDVLVIHHVKPRSKLFIPTDDNCPLPLKYLDVMRQTYTDLETKVESSIEDVWTDDGDKILSNPWTGRTVFYPLKPPAPAGYIWIEGRLTKVQQTTRPDNVWPEVWQAMSKKQKLEAIEKWKTLKAKFAEARSKRGISDIDPDDLEFKRITPELRAKLSTSKSPAMPPFSENGSVGGPEAKVTASKRSHEGAQNSGTKTSNRPHQDHFAPKGFESETWYNFVHTPVPIPKAM
jgi:hypothetical protein